MSNVRALVAAIVGLFVVGGVGTYVVMENRGVSIVDAELASDDTSNSSSDSSAPGSDADEDEPSSDQSSGQSSGTDAALDEDRSEAAGEQQNADSTNDASPPDDANPTANWAMGSFDLLRVEPDGSTVIAGKGQPNTSVKILNGDDVLAQTQIGSSGDFVIIFDQPLNKGDYQMSLLIEDENGNSLLSEEQALVSIPEDADGQVLAMVSKPGEASRILTAPEVDMPAEKGVEVAVADTSSDDAAQTSPPETKADTSSDAAADDDMTDTRVADTNMADIGNTGTEPEATGDAEDKMGIAASETISPDDQIDVASQLDGTLADGSSADGTLADGTLADGTPADGTLAKPTADPTTETNIEADAALKIAEPQMEELKVEEPKIDTPKVVANVRIEAVEVEGDRLFVAGVGTLGNQVRIFVDDKEAGLSAVNNEGRFLLETTMPLSVGDHMITAALEDQSNNVLLRAIVPFVRPETEAAAAVASEQAEDVSSENIDVAQMVDETKDTEIKDAETKDAETQDTEMKDGKTQGETTSSETGTGEGGAPAASGDVANDDQATTMSDDKSDAAKDEVQSQPAEKVADTAANQQELLQQKTAETDTQSNKMVAEADAAEPDPAQVDGQAKSQAESQADIQVDSQADVQMGADKAEQNEPQTIVQETLTPAASQSVIIRRGDTLWQIARRTYGQGVRYTTIYLANQDQIRNPNRISPGQIFNVPDEGMDFDEAEDIHLKWLRDNR